MLLDSKKSIKTSQLHDLHDTVLKVLKDQHPIVAFDVKVQTNKVAQFIRINLPNR